LRRLDEMPDEEMAEWQDRFRKRCARALDASSEEWRRALKRIGILD
jgi:hypothetical protein